MKSNLSINISLCNDINNNNYVQHIPLEYIRFKKGKFGTLYSPTELNTTTRLIKISNIVHPTDSRYHSISLRTAQKESRRILLFSEWFSQTFPENAMRIFQCEPIVIDNTVKLKMLIEYIPNAITLSSFIDKIEIKDSLKKNIVQKCKDILSSISDNKRNAKHNDIHLDNILVKQQDDKWIPVFIDYDLSQIDLLQPMQDTKFPWNNTFNDIQKFLQIDKIKNFI